MPSEVFYGLLVLILLLLILLWETPRTHPPK